MEYININHTVPEDIQDCFNKYDSIETFWQKTNRPDYMAWLLLNNSPTAKVKVKFLLDLIGLLEGKIRNEKSVISINDAKDFLNGKTNEKQFKQRLLDDDGLKKTIIYNSAITRSLNPSKVFNGICIVKYVESKLNKSKQNGNKIVADFIREYITP